MPIYPPVCLPVCSSVSLPRYPSLSFVQILSSFRPEIQLFSNQHVLTSWFLSCCLYAGIMLSCAWIAILKYKSSDQYDSMFAVGTDRCPLGLFVHAVKCVMEWAII